MADSETKQSPRPSPGTADSEGKPSPPPQQTTADSEGKQSPPPSQQTADSEGKQSTPPPPPPPPQQAADSEGKQSPPPPVDSEGEQSTPPPQQTADSEGKKSTPTADSGGKQSTPPPPPPQQTADSEGKQSTTPPPPPPADSEIKQSSPPPPQPAETVQVQESNGNNNNNSEEKPLKHLEFVQVAAIYFLACFFAVYDYAKDNSGPLKPGVESVEATVKTVIGPVYEKLRDAPLELLVFVDGKVDLALSEAEGRVPAAVKQALLAANKAAAEVRRLGGVAAAWKEWEPAAEEWAVGAWRWLNGLPLFPVVAHMVVPTAAFWSEKYNGAVACAAEMGLPAAGYMPVIPVERIAKVFEERGSGPGPALVTANGDASDGTEENTRAVVGGFV